VGWAESRKGLGLTWHYGWGETYDYRIPLRGLCVEALLETQVTTDLSIALIGANMWPEAESNGFTGITSRRWGERVFDAKNIEYWSVGAYANYLAFNPLELIGGIRWNQLQLETDEQDTLDPGIYGENHKLSFFMPFAGLRVRYAGLSVEAIGFPWVGSEYIISPTTIDLAVWRRTFAREVMSSKRSFYLEFAAEYNQKLYRDMIFGTFAKFSTIQCAPDGMWQNLSPTTGAVIHNYPLETSVNITHWTFGGNLAIPFKSPI
jgi:hypothetical protein